MFRDLLSLGPHCASWEALPELHSTQLPNVADVIWATISHSVPSACVRKDMPQPSMLGLLLLVDHPLKRRNELCFIVSTQPKENAQILPPSPNSLFSCLQDSPKQQAHVLMCTHTPTLGCACWVHPHTVLCPTVAPNGHRRVSAA